MNADSRIFSSTLPDFPVLKGERKKNHSGTLFWHLHSFTVSENGEGQKHKEGMIHGMMRKKKQIQQASEKIT
jgi:hypothetical protein